MPMGVGRKAVGGIGWELSLSRASRIAGHVAPVTRRITVIEGSPQTGPGWRHGLAVDGVSRAVRGGVVRDHANNTRNPLYKRFGP